MLFLIDYENVGNAGMKGYEHLDARDHVIIFYSDAMRNIERRVVDTISSCGCVFEVCKLCKPGKNALDFYIVSRLGELIGSGYDGIAVIISQDGGFRAVRDYWEKRSKHRRHMCLAPSIEDGIVTGDENNSRTRELKKNREILNIGWYYSKYAEKIRTKSVLEKLFEGTEYQDMVEEIQNLIQERKKTAKTIYLDSLHRFGRKRGLEIYRMLKECEELRCFVRPGSGQYA